MQYAPTIPGKIPAFYAYSQGDEESGLRIPFEDSINHQPREDDEFKVLIKNLNSEVVMETTGTKKEDAIFVPITKNLLGCTAIFSSNIFSGSALAIDRIFNLTFSDKGGNTYDTFKIENKEIYYGNQYDNQKVYSNNSWEDIKYRTIYISGGADLQKGVTSSWFEQYSVLTEPVVDLTDYIWVGNEELNISEDIEWSVDFSSNDGVTYSGLKLNNHELKYTHDSQEYLAWDMENGWFSGPTQYIEFSGPGNQELITWLQLNGSLLNKNTELTNYEWFGNEQLEYVEDIITPDDTFTFYDLNNNYYFRFIFNHDYYGKLQLIYNNDPVYTEDNGWINQGYRGIKIKKLIDNPDLKKWLLHNGTLFPPTPLFKTPLLSIGQFYKIQVAYLDNDINPKYSTIGVTKYIEKPTTYVADIEDGHTKTQYKGYYSYPETDNETEYSYSFYFYEEGKLLDKIENQIHSPSAAFDSFVPKWGCEENKNYRLIYIVTTLNGLVITKEYNLIYQEPTDSPTIIPAFSISENYEEGYIDINFQETFSISTLRRVRWRGNYVLSNFGEWNYSINYVNAIQESCVSFGSSYMFDRYYLTGLVNGTSTLYYDNKDNIWTYFPCQTLTFIDGNDINNPMLIQWLGSNGTFDASGTFALLRADASTDFHYWELINKVTLSLGDPITKLNYKDFYIEHGQTYKYAFVEIKEDGSYSRKIISNAITPYFEHMFLYDGERQLKIKFNPQVSSFKNDILETKLETIGGRYPRFFRNGNVNYKEFPINGLISYWIDEEENFMPLQELGLLDNQFHRGDIIPNDAHFRGYNQDDANFYAERKFKLAALDWLDNGKPKFFKSPAEGSYIVRLMSVSMSPEQQLSRMIHSFSATAYEIADNSINSLKEFNLIKEE